LWLHQWMSDVCSKTSPPLCERELTLLKTDQSWELSSHSSGIKSTFHHDVRTTCVGRGVPYPLIIRQSCPHYHPPRTLCHRWHASSSGRSYSEHHLGRRQGWHWRVWGVSLAKSWRYDEAAYMVGFQTCLELCELRWPGFIRGSVVIVAGEYFVSEPICSRHGLEILLQARHLCETWSH